MSKEVTIELHVCKTVQYGEDLESIEDKLQETLEDEDFSVQIFEAEINDN